MRIFYLLVWVFTAWGVSAQPKTKPLNLPVSPTDTLLFHQNASTLYAKLLPPFRGKEAIDRNLNYVLLLDVAATGEVQTTTFIPYAGTHPVGTAIARQMEAVVGQQLIVPKDLHQDFHIVLPVLLRYGADQDYREVPIGFNAFLEGIVASAAGRLSHPLVVYRKKPREEGGCYLAPPRLPKAFRKLQVRIPFRTD
ncbi:MAG: hypothetical protein AAFZ52_08345 [Bacteroidota bacterium]